MNILKAMIFALSLASTGCYMDDVAPTPVVIYRANYGYGYWYANTWYGAPRGYVYGRPIYWGEHYRYYGTRGRYRR